MVATNWRTNRESYQRFEDALDRLRGTTIKTDIPTGDHRQTRGFGLIDEYEITRRDEEGEESVFGRMTKVRIKLSDWTFRAVQSMEVLTINPQYFRLRRPLERRIYELARKHVGDQGHSFKIGLEKLQKKVGSNSPAKKFKFFVKQIAQDEHLPDYDIDLQGSNVVFTVKQQGFTKRQAEMDLGLPDSERGRFAAAGGRYAQPMAFCSGSIGERARGALVKPTGAFRSWGSGQPSSRVMANSPGQNPDAPILRTGALAKEWEDGASLGTMTQAIACCQCFLAGFPDRRLLAAGGSECRTI